jgi:K+-transporting ATPase ATPase C chain
MIKLIIQSIRQTIVWTIIAGMLYPLVMTLLFQGLFPAQANGSLVERDGKVVGSSLLAQQFQTNKYFWSRPSANSYGVSAAFAGNSLAASSGSNLGPTSAQLQTNLDGNLKNERDANKVSADTPVPADLVFASASGLDPEISPEAAQFQIKRVATARAASPDKIPALVDKITALVNQFTQPLQWGFLGEPRVNVLLLNLELDKQFPAPPDATPAAAAPAPAATSAPASTAAPAAMAAPTSTSPATTAPATTAPAAATDSKP